jgi:hypothetical protein
MEQTIVEKTKTVAEKIAEVPAVVVKVIVEGAEVIGHDVKKGVVEAGTIVVEDTKIVASDVAEASKHVGRDVKQAVDPAPVT